MSIWNAFVGRHRRSSSSSSSSSLTHEVYSRFSSTLEFAIVPTFMRERKRGEKKSKKERKNTLADAYVRFRAHVICILSTAVKFSFLALVKKKVLIIIKYNSSTRVWALEKRRKLNHFYAPTTYYHFFIFKVFVEIKNYKVMSWIFGLNYIKTGISNLWII